MTTFTDDETFAGDVADHAVTSSTVGVLIDFFGPISFVEIDADAAALGFTLATSQPGSFKSAFLGKPVRALTAEEAAPLNPISYLSQARSLAVWIQAGAADTCVPYLQSQRFAQACQTAFGDDAVYYALLADAGHMDEVFYTGDNLDALIAFLNEHL